MIDLSTLTDAQRRVVTTLDEPIFVAAGAGSGKTYTLTQRIVWALSEGSGTDGSPYLDSLDQALIITYTDKAAGEIRERVRGALHKAQMASFALQVDTAWISTIHGMCARILRRHALELGIDPEFGMLGESVCDELRDSALEQILAEVSTDPAYESLFSTYNARGHARLGDSAKTVAGMVDAITKKVLAAPDGFASLSFPGDSPDVTELLGDLLASYEALCAHKTKDEAERARIEASRASLDAYLRNVAPASRSVSSALEVVQDLANPNGTKWRGCPFREVQAALGQARFALGIEQALGYQEPLMDIVRRVDEAYVASKRALSGLDNDDLLRLTLAAFRDHPRIASRYADQFRLVMVDEFQDTNAQQVEMIKLLSGQGACHLATVGDAQQSIYRFRGADVEVFRARQGEVGDDDIIRLDRNFRSHDDILRFVSAACGTSGILPDFMDLSSDEHRRNAYRAPGIPRVTLELTSIVKHKSSFPGRQSQAQAQAAQIADRLARLVAAGERPGDMALLLGSTSLATIYIDALRARGIDCVVAKGSTFSGEPEVAVVAALLHVLANPLDTATGLFPVLTSEMFRLDADDLCALGTKMQDAVDAMARRTIYRGIADMEFPPGVIPSRRLDAARRVLDHAWSRIATERPADVLLGAIRESGWLARLEAQGTDGRAQAANVLAAVRHVRDLTEEMGLGVARAAFEFDHWLAVAKEPPASLAGGELDALRIMTVHGSKGLEFPIVAVAECCNDPRDESNGGVVASSFGGEVRMALAPPEASPKGIEAPESAHDCRSHADWRSYLAAREREGSLAEKGRLLYVALTRAREALVLGCTVVPTKDKLTPIIAGQMVGSLFGGTLPPAGESQVGYGGSAPAVVRHCVLEYDADKNVTVESAGTLDEVEEAVAAEGGPFLLYDDASPDLPQTTSWSPRDGVFSFSSVVGEARRDEGGDEPPEPSPGRDSDRATDLGSAFHELAQLMVERGAFPPVGRIDAVAGIWGLSGRQRVRLDAALVRWHDSTVRAEALSHGLVRAEVPFFCRVASTHGEYLEGAIDLLATDPGQTSALVVDYKTGDADKGPDELRESHELQARFYARVLLDQGFERVSCRFVCVERDAGDGQPVVVPYEFSSADPPELG